jgi:Na+-transporting methylmalonyl-CoA/oxaloacetate decarboxylase gamma subunit
MLLGIGTVFVGLIILIFITKLSSAIIIAIEKKKSAAAPAADGQQGTTIPNRGALVAVVAACVAEVMGKDVSGLRIVSLKRVD